MAYRSSYNVCIEGGTDRMVYRLLVFIYNEGDMNGLPVIIASVYQDGEINVYQSYYSIHL